MKQLHSHILRLTLIVSLSGCTGNRAQKTEIKEPTLPPGAVVTGKASEKTAIELAKSGNVKAAANEYARIGELLLLPEGFVYADKMFDEALKLDADNAKANFYSAFTKLLTTNQGWYTRLERIANEKELYTLMKAKELILSHNLPEITQWTTALPSGFAPFSKYYDMQRFLRTSLLPEVENSIAKLQKTLSQKVELNINLARLGLLNTSVSSSTGSSCSQGQYEYETSRYNYTTGKNEKVIVQQNYWNCYSYSNRVESITNFFKSKSVELDSNDKSMLLTQFKVVRDGLSVSTAYSFEDSEYARKQFEVLLKLRKARGKNLTTQDVVAIITSYPKLFILESDHRLNTIKAGLEDTLATLIQFNKVKNELCQNPVRTSTNVLIKSICVGMDVADQAAQTLNYLVGPKPFLLGYDASGAEVNISMDLTKVLLDPPKNLQLLLPTAFDNKGNPTNAPDATMGGLFPNGDLVTKLNQVTLHKHLKTIKGAASHELNDSASENHWD